MLRSRFANSPYSLDSSLVASFLGLLSQVISVADRSRQLLCLHLRFGRSLLRIRRALWEFNASNVRSRRRKTAGRDFEIIVEHLFDAEIARTACLLDLELVVCDPGGYPTSGCLNFRRGLLGVGHSLRELNASDVRSRRRNVAFDDLAFRHKPIHSPLLVSYGLSLSTGHFGFLCRIVLRAGALLRSVGFEPCGSIGMLR